MDGRIKNEGKVPESVCFAAVMLSFGVSQVRWRRARGEGREARPARLMLMLMSER